ncbi:MAG: TadE/TadG family type IV pilus assembly protein [Brevundimonas sp.]|uniref:TadE/TadG family type IV pilus assembly protein n=1 Tax=Brevundimonas sp. TaxID=1871086 RepID=UPI0039193B90
MMRPLAAASARSRRRKSREGAAAVEFGIVALPFFFMMFAIFEIGMVFVTSSLLENATMETARLVRTGQASTRNFDKAAFKTEMCSRMSIFAGDCEGRAEIDVREVPAFGNPVLPDPMAGGTFDTGQTSYANGQPGSLMVVRAWYQQPLVTPFLSQGLSRLNNGKAMLSATTAFRNEPWGWGAGGSGSNP